MKMKKTMVAIILAVAMVLALIPVVTMAAKPAQDTSLTSSMVVKNYYHCEVGTPIIYHYQSWFIQKYKVITIQIDYFANDADLRANTNIIGSETYNVVEYNGKVPVFGVTDNYDAWTHPDIAAKQTNLNINSTNGSASFVLVVTPSY